jgi:NADH-quinone oxidoreductase subunit K
MKNSLNFDLFFFISFDFFKYISFCFVVFFIGSLGVFLTRRNIIVILMSIELMLLAINFLFIFFSLYLDDLLGQVFSLYILTIAAAESAIGLALIVIYYRLRNVISIDYISNIKG